MDRVYSGQRIRPAANDARKGTQVKNTITHHWPLYVAIAIFLMIVTAILGVSLSMNQGRLVYTLDDPYIGMAMARNLAHYGVWGATRYAFTSCSSPPFWDLFFTLADLIAAYAIMDWYKVAALTRFATLLALILLIPLPAQVMTGMEPPVQILVSMLAVFLAARWLSGESAATVRGDSMGLLGLAPVITGVRFEGMFLIIAIGMLLMALRRWICALAFCVLGFLPVLIYGLISVAKGWFWLPNSVLLKATLPASTSPGGFVLSLCYAIMTNTRMALHVPALLLAVLLVYLAASGKGSGRKESRQLMGTIILLVGIAHMEFVRPTLLYRYDAYLSALAMLFVAVQLPVIIPVWPRLLSLETWGVPKHAAAGALALALFFPVAMEGGVLLWQVPQCTHNIFDQQYQMASFVRTYYQGSSLALNDIGAVNYYADIHCLDLWGLATMPVAKAKRGHRYDRALVASLSRQAQVRIAIVYDAWFEGMLPPDWVRVGAWTITNNMVAANDTVSFYAASPAEAPHLMECLREYSAQLPGDVIQRGPYLSWGSGRVVP